MPTLERKRRKGTVLVMVKESRSAGLIALATGLGGSAAGALPTKTEPRAAKATPRKQTDILRTMVGGAPGFSCGPAARWRQADSPAPGTRAA